MDLNIILVGAEVVVAILLCFSVLIQKKGTAMSASFGGQSSEANTSFYGNRRGAELFLFRFTILLGFLLFSIGLIYHIIY